MPEVRQNRKASDDLDVEILTSEGLWEHLGVARPSHSSVAFSPPEQRFARTWMSVVPVLCTLILHGLLVGGLVFGSAGRPLVKREASIEGLSAAGDNAPQTSTVLIFLNSHSIASPDWSPEEMDFPLAPLQDRTEDAILVSIDSLRQPQLDGTEGGADEESPTLESVGDGAGRALLFGRYMGQIKARIERAWSYPLAAGTDRFDCRVLIKQDRRGAVQEVTLQRCGDDPDWQLSLVQAIQQASPLSGPPDESVFTEIVTLYFSVAAAPMIVDTSANR